jgi:paraquat-inducible protein A
VPTLALLALALLAAGLTLPLLTIDKWTFWSNEYSVLPGISDLFRNGYALMGVVLAIFVVVTPVVQVLSAAGLWIAGRSAGLRSRMATALRWAGRWAMADVFALGIAIVLSKIGGVVNVTPRPGLWLFLAGAVLGSVLCGRLTAPRAEPRATGAVPVSVA